MSEEIQPSAEVTTEVETPVVQPEAEQDTSAPPAEGTEPETGEKDTPAEKTFTQKELDEILAKKTAKLARQRDQERNKREQVEREIAKASLPRDEGKPNPVNYSDLEQYTNDVAKWALGQREKEEQVVQQHKSASTFEAKAHDIRAELEESADFDAVKYDKLPISEPMALAIVDSEIGVKLAQHLYEHPSEAERISALPPARQAAEIGKLEEKLSTAAKTSKTPPPINPIGKGQAVTNRRLEDLPMNEYIAARKKMGNTRY
jgi:hypothetical protein